MHFLLSDRSAAEGHLICTYSDFNFSLYFIFRQTSFANSTKPVWIWKVDFYIFCELNYLHSFILCSEAFGYTATIWVSFLDENLTNNEIENFFVDVFRGSLNCFMKDKWFILKVETREILAQKSIFLELSWNFQVNIFIYSLHSSFFPSPQFSHHISHYNIPI